MCSSAVLYGVWVGASGELVINLSMCAEQSLIDLVSGCNSIWVALYLTQEPGV